MSDLISGKEALIALANGEDVLFRNKITGDVNHAKYQTVECIQNEYYGYQSERIYLEFFIKPRTITINGVEVPAPFEPKKGDMYYRVNPTCLKGDYYKTHSFSDDPFDHSCAEFGVWRTEEEIKQVVAALRSVFKPQ